MLDLNPQVMLLVDAAGKVLRVNRALLRLLMAPGFETVLNKRLPELFACDDPHFFTRLLAGKESCRTAETSAVLPGMQKRVLRFSAVNSGRDVSALIVEDITQDKKLAAQTEKKHKKEAVQALVGGLMHNVNQPLTVIMVQAHFILMSLERQRGDPVGLRRELENIMAQAMRIAAMIKGVGRPGDFVTERYLDGIEILDIKRSAGGQEGPVVESGAAIAEILLVALDAHEPGAAAHARRTSRTAALLARHMDLKAAEIPLAERCARYHDIGKIAVPDAVLRKPGELNSEELGLVRSHTEIGGNILRRLPLMIQEADTALTHHEWFNGGGYPRGLRSKEISLYSRITAVADAFDALRFRRLYHPALPREEVIARITARAETQFDPQIVRVLRRHRAELDAVEAPG